MNNCATQESVSADTNGLGSVTLQLHGEGKVIHMTSDQARKLANELLTRATEVDFQNTVL